MRTKQKTRQVIVRLNEAVEKALRTIEKAVGPEVYGARSVAIRRAILNEAARLTDAS